MRVLGEEIPDNGVSERSVLNMEDSGRGVSDMGV